ncbi:ABC transporter permease [Paenibacillaceae bacterium WGS1546]|uniref:ABC transporter permease n=1 Tax=Cohnella sp. WGS1546 TaxID=3366810 RepID=UPI00372D5E33
MAKRKIRVKSLSTLYLLLSPALILLFVFNYLPMYGLIVSFQDYSIYQGFWRSEWVGFKHFAYFLTDDKFWSVMRNTLLLNVYDIAFGFTAPILFALLVNEVLKNKFKKIVQTVSYLPHFLSWIVVAGLVHQMLSPAGGLVNVALEFLFGINPIDFMTDKGMFRSIAVISEIWKSVGWAAILYFAVIAGVDTTLYEASMIDGAGRFKKALHITLPAMIPMIVLLFLLKLAAIFTIGFERVFLLQNPLVYDVSEVIPTYVYRLGLQQAQYSLTTAIGLSQSLIAFILLVVSNRMSKKWTGMGLY